MEPLWTILIFYAFLVLTAIYTYQFSYIRDIWIDALNSSHNDLSVDEMYVYTVSTLTFERLFFDYSESIKNLIMN